MGGYASGFPQSYDANGPEDSDAERGELSLEEPEDLDEAGEPKGFQPLIEGLTGELEKKLISIVEDVERESYPIWRWLNRDFFQAESFWKDLQEGFYDATSDIWRVPNVKQLNQISENGQRFTYQTNIYRALGGSIVSTLGQKMPTTRYLPEDFRRESDELAADAAAVVTPLIERNNRISLLNARAAYLLYTHGIVVSYVRYLEDSERFGWKEAPQIAYKKAVLREAGYECFYCSSFASPDQVVQNSSGGSLTGGEDPDNPSQEPPIPMQTCPNCGRGLSEVNYRPEEYGDVPYEVGTQLVPRGREVITLHGGLESRIPPWCSDFEDWPYYGLVHEVHISSLRGTYGRRAKGLQGGWGSGPYDTWDRFARLALIEPTVSYYGTSNQNLVTFKRYWLKPSLFYMCDNDTDRQTLLDIFPDGAYIAYADTKKLLDARNERMSDHIRFCRAVEGAGAYTPAMGSSVISVQKRFNTVQNFIMEWIEYAAAGTGTFVNANVINYKALKGHRRAPGTFYPLRMTVGSNLSSAIYESKPGQIAGEVLRHGDELKGQAEFLAGAPPTVTGGTEMSLKPTTYLSDKESALGRLYTAWMHLRIFWSETMGLAVKEFARWRTEDEQYTTFGPDGAAQGKIIRLKDLDGNFDAYPETNEQFPVLWQDMRSTFMELMQMSAQDPRIGEIIGDLDNNKFCKAMLGLPDLYVPGEDDRLKQKHEIGMLLQGGPMPPQQQQPGAPPVPLDPITQQPVIMPSIGIDPFEDNHQVHEDTVKKWAVSAEGLKAKIANVNGYKNVIAHGLMHERYRLGMQAMMQARQEQMGAQPQGGDGNGSSSGGPANGGVRRGSSAGAGGAKGAPGKGGGKEPAKPKGQSDNSAQAGGASPVKQTEGIKSGIEQKVGLK